MERSFQNWMKDPVLTNQPHWHWHWHFIGHWIPFEIKIESDFACACNNKPKVSYIIYLCVPSSRALVNFNIKAL